MKQKNICDICEYQMGGMAVPGSVDSSHRTELIIVKDFKKIIVKDFRKIVKDLKEKSSKVFLKRNNR